MFFSYENQINFHVCITLVAALSNARITADHENGDVLRETGLERNTVDASFCQRGSTSMKHTRALIVSRTRTRKGWGWVWGEGGVERRKIENLSTQRKQRVEKKQSNMKKED